LGLTAGKLSLARDGKVNRMTPQRDESLAARIEPVELPVRAAPPASVPASTLRVPPTIDPDPWATVKVWRVVPERVDDPLEYLLSVLDSSERERAHNKQMGQSRRTYLIAHACLREILAAELGVESREVAFAPLIGPIDKPALADSTHGLTFNLSHTRGLILIALARGREIGIDVEWLGRRVRETVLSRRHFTEPELSELECVPRVERVRSFLQLWTRREAHAKMTGEGLRRAITDGTGPNGPFGGAASWVCDLDLGPHHVGAVAVQLRT